MGVQKGKHNGADEDDHQAGDRKVLEKPVWLDLFLGKLVFHHLGALGR
jgi:hypothetical protein